jgi:hypothetical protein
MIWDLAFHFLKIIVNAKSKDETMNEIGSMDLVSTLWFFNWHIVNIWKSKNKSGFHILDMKFIVIVWEISFWLFT